MQKNVPTQIYLFFKKPHIQISNSKTNASCLHKYHVIFFKITITNFQNFTMFMKMNKRTKINIIKKPSPLLSDIPQKWPSFDTRVWWLVLLGRRTRPCPTSWPLPGTASGHPAEQGHGPPRPQAPSASVSVSDCPSAQSGLPALHVHSK